MAPTSVGERLFETLLITQNLIFPPPSPVCYSFLVSYIAAPASQLTMKGPKCRLGILQSLFPEAENKVSLASFLRGAPVVVGNGQLASLTGHLDVGSCSQGREGLGRENTISTSLSCPFHPVQVKCATRQPGTLRRVRAGKVGAPSCL